jgi:acyl dehydratase
LVQQREFPRITEGELERLRQRLGKPIEIRDAFNRNATSDTIRHFAHGMGDTNPLFTDDDYGKGTRWGAVIAPPTFLFSCFGRGAPMGLPGVHGMWAGASFQLHDVIREGTAIRGTVTPSGLTPKETRFAGRAILQEQTYDFSTPEGRSLARVKEWNLRTERDTARIKGKYRSLTPASYTPEEIERIFSDYDREELRGAVPRYWEDVQEGDELPFVVKGPLRVTDNVAWKIGWGFRPFAYAHKIAVDFYKKSPHAFILNEQGIPDVPERVHWDPDFARRVGVPSAYDFGPQRVAWLGQVVTNWMGDDGVVREFWGEVRRFNLNGDTHWLKGKVAGKRRDGGRAVVDLELWGDDQRGETTIRGGAVVQLPTRS